MEEEVLIRVYYGSSASLQLLFFCDAVGRLPQQTRLRIKVEYCSLKNVREKGWSPGELVTWLLDCNIHIILTHPHQGHKIWNCHEVYQSIERLRDHKGFPTGQQLDCPVFRQDKFCYVDSLTHITIPTFRMNLDQSLGAHEQILAMYMPLRKFCESVGGENGWVVKLPFVTNCEAIKFPRTFDAILDRFEFLLKKYSHRIPYAMVQPRLTNRQENRIIVRNGKAEYSVPITVGGGKRIQFGTSHDRFKFAEQAVALLGSECPGAITDFVIRVDIMQLNTGKMVVNEFESLEAVSVSESRKAGQFEIATNGFIQSFWFTTLVKLISEF